MSITYHDDLPILETGLIDNTNKIALLASWKSKNTTYKTKTIRVWVNEESPIRLIDYDNIVCYGEFELVFFDYGSPRDSKNKTYRYEVKTKHTKRTKIKFLGGKSTLHTMHTDHLE